MALFCKKHAEDPHPPLDCKDCPPAPEFKFGGWYLCLCQAGFPSIEEKLVHLTKCPEFRKVRIGMGAEAAVEHAAAVAS